MAQKLISSRQHPLIKYLVKIRENRSFRYQEKKVMLAGEKVIEELLTTEIPEMVFALEETSLSKDLPLTLVTKEVLQKITGLSTPAKMAALFPMPSFSPLEDKKYILVCDEIIDPGNLGTLIRTACGLGWEGIIFTPKTVDPFNGKALRSAKGATFHIPMNIMEKEEIVTLARKKSFTAFFADLSGKEVEKIEIRSPLMVILSKESGIDPLFASHFTAVTLPMKEVIDSYNVAAAGAILLYLMRPKV